MARDIPGSDLAQFAKLGFNQTVEVLSNGRGKLVDTVAKNMDSKFGHMDMQIGKALAGLQVPIVLEHVPAPDAAANKVADAVPAQQPGKADVRSV